MKGQTSMGVIDEIKGKKAVVMFGQIRTTLPLDMLESGSTPPTRNPEKDNPKATNASMAGGRYMISKATLDHMHQTQLNFHQEIDVRGMRGDEALETVTRFIDDATLVGAARVRILHGTGTGALRQLIRQYLQSIPNVSSARDEHVQFGGAGITVVELS